MIEMEKISNLVLIALIVMFAHSANAQNDVPKKTKYYDIHNDKTKDSNFDHVINYLLDNDYMIDEKDKELGTIVTRPKEFKGHSAFYKFRVKDSLITISGNYRQSQANAVLFGSTYRDGFEEIKKRGSISNRPGEKKAFEQILKVANDLGDTVTFRP